MKINELMKMSSERLNEIVSTWMEPKPEERLTYRELEKADGGSYTCWKVFSPDRWWHLDIDIGIAEQNGLMDFKPPWEPVYDLCNEEALSIIWEIEERIRSKDLHKVYVEALKIVTSVESADASLFDFCHANAKQRCVALAYVCITNKESLGK